MLNSDFPSIDPGKFRHQITLLDQIAGSDASGATVTYAADNPPIMAWAQIDYLRGDEVLKSGQDVGQVYIKVTMWYRSQFTPNKRIQTADGEQFIIQFVEDVKKMRTFQVMTCMGVGYAG